MLDQPAVTADDLLAIAVPAGLDQLVSLRRVFEESLFPQLAQRVGLWAIGPTFVSSRLVGGADADLIAAGLLLDLKVTMGAKGRDGSYRLRLDKQDLYQLVGYALLDTVDAYGINKVGTFSARYGHLATWSLLALLDELAGHSVDLATVRVEFHQMLRTAVSAGTRTQRAHDHRKVAPGGHGFIVKRGRWSTSDRSHRATQACYEVRTAITCRTERAVVVPVLLVGPA